MMKKIFVVLSIVFLWTVGCSPKADNKEPTDDDYGGILLVPFSPNTLAEK
jgi:hypothetical protein